jgi:hypothetical protein
MPENLAAANKLSRSSTALVYGRRELQTRRSFDWIEPLSMTTGRAHSDARWVTKQEFTTFCRVTGWREVLPSSPEGTVGINPDYRSKSLGTAAG